MSKIILSVVFLGTPAIAVDSMRAILVECFSVKAVVTAPDKPSGRGLQLSLSPVKLFALQHNLPLLQPENLRDTSFLEKLTQLAADVFIVVAFRFLPEEVWRIPPMGTVNLHASLLPQYRGAAPINWAIINGEKETGVTTFFIEKNIDTGHIIFQDKTTIEDHDNAGSLHDKLMYLGASLVIKTLYALYDGTIESKPQSLYLHNVRLHDAPKIHRDDCKIQWNMPVRQIHNHIRGLSPYPCAWTVLSLPDKQLDVKIYVSAIEEQSHHFSCGIIVSDNRNYIKVAAQDGFIDIRELQVAGKKRMPAVEYLKGQKIPSSAIFI